MCFIGPFYVLAYYVKAIVIDSCDLCLGINVILCKFTFVLEDLLRHTFHLFL